MTPFLQEGENSTIVSNEYLDQSNHFIYRSQIINDMMKIVRKIAPTRTSVLIIGAKGVGKNHLAHYIHEQSRVRLGPFHNLHCGILSPRIFEAELFGFKGDRFTSSFEGALSRTDGGTLFLDEIDQMPMNVQEKFLRFLNTRKFTPVRSNQSLSVQVRIVYSTSDANKLTDGNFNKKLYEKIQPVLVRIPSLSERKEDIPDLVRYFLSLNLSRSKKYHKYTISEQAMDALRCYEWSGNVRELKNICEHLQIFSNKSKIIVKDLPSSILDTRKSSFSVEYDPSLTLSDVNRLYILNALKHFSSKKQAAQALGITVKTLYNRLHEYGVFDQYAIHAKS